MRFVYCPPTTIRNFPIPFKMLLTSLTINFCRYVTYTETSIFVFKSQSNYVWIFLREISISLADLFLLTAPSLFNPLRLALNPMGEEDKLVEPSSSAVCSALPSELLINLAPFSEKEIHQKRTSLITSLSCQLSFTSFEKHGLLHESSVRRDERWKERRGNLQ